MHKFAIIVKSYIPDATRAKRCINSLNKHNKDNLPIYLIIKKEEEVFFNKVFGDIEVNIVYDEEIAKTPSMPGWLYQQIIKSQFWVTGLAENYLCVDSDVVFFKDYYLSDFMYDDNTPYTVIGERKDFLDEAYLLGRVTKHSDFQNRDMLGARITKATKVLRDIIPNIHQKFYDYGTAPYNFSGKVWKSFHDNYLIPNKITFTDLAIQLNSIGVMSESCIYGEYFLYCNEVRLLPVSPYVKCYHDKKHYEWDTQQGRKLEHLKLNWFGYAFQSNWAEDSKEL